MAKRKRGLPAGAFSSAPPAAGWAGAIPGWQAASKAPAALAPAHLRNDLLVMRVDIAIPSSIWNESGPAQTAPPTKTTPK